MEQEKLNQLALFYYSRKDVQEAILKFCQDRETVPRYYEGFGKRPDSIQFPGDIIQQVKKGATSFHCSEELWNNPLEISTDMSKEQANQLRTGWDLIIDIDCKYFDYSKKAALAVIKALKSTGIKNLGCKFSGSKGWHIIVPWQAFPEEINGIKTKDMFPEWPRIICEYLKFISRDYLEKEILESGEEYKKLGQGGVKCRNCGNLADRFSEVTYYCERCRIRETIKVPDRKFVKKTEKNSPIPEDRKCAHCRKIMVETERKEFHICKKCSLDSRTDKENFAISIDIFSILGLDLVLVSPRHLFRAPYSVSYEEPILLNKFRGQNKSEIIEVGKFVDKFFNDDKDFQVKDISDLGYNTVSLNLKENKTRLSQVTKVIRHKIKEPLYLIRLESGRKIRITSGHSVFILDNGKIRTIKGNQLKKGDYLVGIRKINLDNKNKTQINISNELLDILEASVKEKIYLSNFDYSIFKEVYNILSKDEKIKRKAYNWKVYQIIPLDIYERLFEISPSYQNLFRNSEIKYCKHGGPGRNLFNNICINKSLMRLLGYYCAEGHCDSRGRVTLSFGSHEKDLIEDSKKIVEGLGLSPKIEKPHKTAVQIVINSTILKLIFESLFKCGNNAKEKRIPAVIWDVSEDLKKEFLNAYIKGDGHLEKRGAKIVISTVSKKLKEDLCFLLGILGRGYSLSQRVVTRYYKEKTPCCIIVIQGKSDVEKLGFASFSKRKKNSLVNRFPIKELNLEEVILKSRWKNQYENKKIIKRGFDFIKELNPPKTVMKLISGDSTFLKVVDIEKIKSKRDYVYDLSIKGDENFIGGNCVLLHNSLHEKTGFASVVLSEEEIENFNPLDAEAIKVKIRNFYPQAEKNEARNLLVRALEWNGEKLRNVEVKEEVKEKSEKKYEEIEIDKSSLVYPPSIKRILEGMEDGRKRSLFILLNFYRSLNFTREEVEKKIEEWNKKNPKPLKIGYIQSQIEWTFRQKKMLPPNFDKPFWKDIGIQLEDSELMFKNPVSYTMRKSRRLRK